MAFLMKSQIILVDAWTFWAEKTFIVGEGWGMMLGTQAWFSLLRVKEESMISTCSFVFQK